MLMKKRQSRINNRLSKIRRKADGTIDKRSTIKHRRKLSEKKKGRKNPRYKIKISDETRKRLSIAQRNRIKRERENGLIRTRTFSKETRKKISESLRKLYAKKRRTGVEGRVHSPETRKKISDALKGHKVSEVSKNKMRVKLKGRQTWMKGKKHDTESRRKMSRSHTGVALSESHKQSLKKSRLNQVFPVKDSAPEKRLQKLLKSKKIPFQKHKAVLGQPDVFIKPDLCIFVDGDYWHANPKKFSPNSVIHKASISNNRKQILAKDKWARDKKISDTLKKKGYRVIRLWESDLETHPEKCLQKILRKIQK